jgi:hypothetical protein
VSKTIGLSVPTRDKPGKESFDLRPRKVDQWVDELPRANVGETARRLFEALNETNHLDYPYEERLHFLEAIRETTYYVTNSMKRHFVGFNFPLSNKGRQVASATREIQMAMATGYAITIEDLLSHSFVFPDSKTLAKLLHRAITAYGRVLLTSYQAYSPYPAGVWQDLHHLYATAEKRKLLGVGITDDQHCYVNKTTITGEYTRLLLLALTSPYRLRHGEAGKVYDSLERWNAKCHLVPMGKHQTNGTSFGVNLNTDQPPRSMARAAPECDQQHCRVMDTEALAQRIQKELKKGATLADTTLTGIEMQRPDLSHDLLRRLLIAWCVVSKRGFPRTEIQETVEVTLGLSATHHVIIEGTRSSQPAVDRYTQTANYRSADAATAPRVKPDVWDMVYFPDSELKGFTSLKEQGPPATPAPGNNAHYHPEPWAILNESARGYCLKIAEGDHHAHAQVGELIGIRRSNTAHTWKWGIGIVRWMKTTDDDKLMLGIEMLTPDAAAIGIRAVGQDTGEYSRTLMLPELRAINQPTTLITGAVPYRAGNHAIINILGKEIEIRLTKQRQNTGLFAQFEFEILEQQSHVDNESEHEHPDFGEVWSSL